MDDTTQYSDFDHPVESTDRTADPSSEVQDVSLLDLVAARALDTSKRRESAPRLYAPCPSEATSDDPSGEDDERVQRITMRLGGNGF